MMNTGLYTSDRSDWATPAHFFHALDAIYHFDLDVCASENNHKCSTYFDKEIDGLQQSWGNHICFMNPPYGREIGAWVCKAHEESRKGATVVALLPCRTDTNWWKHVMKADELYFVHKRLHFDDSANAAPFPSCVVVWKPHRQGRKSAPRCKLVDHNFSPIN